MRFILPLLFLLIPVVAEGARLRSPEVHDDGRVTFRLRAPKAESVAAVVLRLDDGRVEMKRDEKGVWEGTIGPLPPGIYEYMLDVDGTRHLDPANRSIKKWYSCQSLFEIEGDPPLVTQLQEVPQGALHHHTYSSPVAGCQRGVIVYTPPSYDESPGRQYPVLFLLHGFGDDQTAWTEVGRAHRIADNLVAAGKAKEMVIVMPFGHPVPMPYEDTTDEYRSQNDSKMVREIDEVLLPWVAKRYRVAETAEQRAITGLSMGGGHSIRIAMATNDFDWVGAFSAAAPRTETPDQLASDLGTLRKELKLFWIACGDKDFLLERNQQFSARLKEANVPHEYIETSGSHNWNVWRDEYLPAFLPLLFQSP
ncbi:MAG: alpha/beta hydrolase-fold protein [Planctomycetota bacterium]